MANSHVFSCASQAEVVRPGAPAAVDASIARCCAALALPRVDPLGFREPHWHPNANELTYCVSGEALVTIFSHGTFTAPFTLRAGVFVPPAIFIISRIPA
jgi:hypothetical protein